MLIACRHSCSELRDCTTLRSKLRPHVCYTNHGSTRTAVHRTKMAVIVGTESVFPRDSAAHAGSMLQSLLCAYVLRLAT